VVQGRNPYDYPRVFIVSAVKSENLVEPGVSPRRRGLTGETGEAKSPKRGFPTQAGINLQMVRLRMGG
jgi:hypothetical protein